MRAKPLNGRPHFKRWSLPPNSIALVLLIHKIIPSFYAAGQRKKLELHTSVHPPHTFAALLENSHSDCVIKAIGSHCQLSRVKQIKLHDIKTRCSQPAYNPPSSNGLQWACILQVSLSQSVFALEPSLGSVSIVRWGVERSPREGYWWRQSRLNESPFSRFCCIIASCLLFNLLA